MELIRLQPFIFKRENNAPFLGIPFNFTGYFFRERFFVSVGGYFCFMSELVPMDVQIQLLSHRIGLTLTLSCHRWWLAFPLCACICCSIKTNIVVRANAVITLVSFFSHTDVTKTITQVQNATSPSSREQQPSPRKCQMSGFKVITQKPSKMPSDFFGFISRKKYQRHFLCLKMKTTYSPVYTNFWGLLCITTTTLVVKSRRDFEAAHRWGHRGTRELRDRKTNQKSGQRNGISCFTRVLACHSWFIWQVKW